MNQKIFLLDENDQLEVLHESGYSSEDLLQGLLARYPDLLAGDQMSDRSPRRWLLVSREVGVPGEQDAGDRWSIDHVFLDQDGVPTLVEVKRSVDTRLRREVVGQLLDYAANAMAYWPAERLRSSFELSHAAENADALLREFLGAREDEFAVEDFWQRVDTNLRAGRLRLVFVADVIPAELRRIIEFLNEQMEAEVLGVEIRQFRSGASGRTTLVPKVVGLTAKAQLRRSAVATPKRSAPWDAASLLEKIRSSSRPDEAPTTEALIEWARTQGLGIVGGTGSTGASLYFTLNDASGVTRKPFYLYHESQTLFHIQFRELPGVLDTLDDRRKLAEELREQAEIELDPEGSYPGIRLTRLRSQETSKRFLMVLQRLVERMRAPARID
ncbi:MAG: hypothetical protein IRZ28_07035 [Steroidobacteraceae bacterium]|nr:hypothetical protein [Steroidobacteraceae bacterium]